MRGGLGILLAAVAIYLIWIAGVIVVVVLAAKWAWGLL